MRELAELYTLMEKTVPVRRRLVEAYLRGSFKDAENPPLSSVRKDVEALRGVYSALTGKSSGGQRIERIVNEEDYEVEELKKDLIFFSQGRKALEEYFFVRHPRFSEEKERLLRFLQQFARESSGGPLSGTSGDTSASGDRGAFDCLFTDRDGTVNNYCGRYRSSIQSAYNAVFLARFAECIKHTPVILTAAPLRDIGIVDISVLPRGVYILAGSKGREYIDTKGNRKNWPVSQKEEKLLDSLNNDIAELLDREENRVFTRIGSGFQRKFGETGLARQDTRGSVPEEESLRLKKEIEGILKKYNREERFFQLEDTGKDLEIMVIGEGDSRHFDKGKGLRFLIDELAVPLKGSRVLVFGDTRSDLSMAETAVKEGARTAAVFVTADEALKDALRSVNGRCCFVSSPDVLVSALYAFEEFYCKKR